MTEEIIKGLIAYMFMAMLIFMFGVSTLSPTTRFEFFKTVVGSIFWPLTVAVVFFGAFFLVVIDAWRSSK